MSEIAICTPDEISYIVSEDGKSITFQPCGRTSHNPNDVNNRYCAACNRFMELILAVREMKKAMFHDR